MHIDQGTQNLFKIIIKKLDNDCFVTTDHIFINLQTQRDILFSERLKLVSRYQMMSGNVRMFQCTLMKEQQIYLKQKQKTPHKGNSFSSLFYPASKSVGHLSNLWNSQMSTEWKSFG